MYPGRIVTSVIGIKWHIELSSGNRHFELNHNQSPNCLFLLKLHSIPRSSRWRPEISLVEAFFEDGLPRDELEAEAVIRHGIAAAVRSVMEIELASRTPCHRIANPVIDVGFPPASAIDADFDLGGERALGDLAVDGGPRQPSPCENGFQADDTIWFGHGRAASCRLFLTAPDPDRASIYGRAREFFASS